MIPKEEQELLAQGIRDYVDVLNAVAAFRSLVQRKCREAVEKMLPRYSEALGADLTKDDIVDAEWNDGHEFVVGVKYMDKGCDAHLWQAISWSPDNAGNLETTITMWVWCKAVYLDRLRDVLRQKGVEYNGEDGRILWIEEEVSATDVGAIDIKLDALMDRWVTLWRRAGGLNVLRG